MLSVIGFATILVIVLLLLSGRVLPIIALALVPVLGAATAGFTPAEIGTFFNDGVQQVLGVAVMFIFAILFFGVMNDVGLFDPIIRAMITWTKGDVVSVCVGTVLIAAIAHLDGSGASTFLITIPALLPLYRRLRMSPYLLLLLIGTSAGIVNMVPWGGPVGRAAAVLKVDPTELWRPLIPLQLIALALTAGMAVVLGLRERRRIARGAGTDAPSELAPDGAGGSPACPGRAPLCVNYLLTAAVIATLVWGVIPAGLVFMVGLCLALPLNFPSAREQMARIKAHAPGALLMAAIILSAGTFLGVLNGSGMLRSLATDLVAWLPDSVAQYLHLLVGLFGVPLELVLNTDSTYFALLPVVLHVVAAHGVSPAAAAHALILGNIIGTFVSPFSPALWLALGLAELEMGRHIRYCLLWMWGLSVAVLLLAVLLGVVPV